MISHGRPGDVLCEGLVARRLVVQPADVVYLKSVVGASEGVAVLFSERGGDVLLVSTPSLRADLDRLADDLEAELGATGSPLPAPR